MCNIPMTIRGRWLVLLLCVPSFLLAATDHAAAGESDSYKNTGTAEGKSFASLQQSCGASYTLPKETGTVGDKVEPEKLEKSRVYLGYDSYFKGMFYRLTDEKGVLDPRPLGEGTLLPCAWLGGEEAFKPDPTALSKEVRSNWCRLNAKDGWSEVPATQIPPSAQIARFAPQTDSTGKLVGSALTRQAAVPSAQEAAAPVPGAAAVDTNTVLSRRRSPTPGAANLAGLTPGQVSSSFSVPPPTAVAGASSFSDIDPRNPPAGTHVYRHTDGRRYTIFGGYQVVIQLDGRVTQRPIGGATTRVGTPVSAPVSVPASSPSRETASTGTPLSTSLPSEEPR